MADTVEDVPTTAAAPPAADGAEEAPKVVKKVSRPSEAKRDAAVAELQTKVDDMLTELRGVREQIAAVKTGSNEYNGQIAEARERINAIRAESKRVRDERSALIDAKKAIQARQAKRRDDRKQARGSGSHGNLGSVKDRIRELEHKQQTETLSLNDEKNLIKELRELHDARRSMAHLESKTSDAKPSDSGAGDKDEWATLNERINARRAELDAINERQQAQRKIVAELQAKKNEQRSSLGGLFERRDQLNKAVRDAKGEISQLKHAHYQQMQEWRAYKRVADAAREKARQAEYDARRAAREAEKKRFEEEEAKRHPWEREMALCDALTSQLAAMVPGAASAGTDESKGGEASDAPANTVSNDGLVLMKKEVQDDYGNLGGGKKKKKGRKGKRGGQKSADKRLVRLDIKAHEQLASVGVAAPRTHADVAGTIAALRAKRAEYNVKPRPAKAGRKAAAATATSGSGSGEAQGADVKTPYGEGVLTATRAEDGMKVVQLKFGVGYMREEDVEASAAEASAEASAKADAEAEA